MDQRRTPQEGSALRDVVVLGGLALQAEDAAIRAAVHHRNEHGGLARMENERYHQFVIWRALLPIWHSTIAIERENSSDLIIKREDGSHYFEMKNWRHENQILAIQRDIEKLKLSPNGYIIVTTLSRKTKTDENIDYLLERISGLSIEHRQEFRFSTVSKDNGEMEFLLAGWPVAHSNLGRPL